MKLLQKLLHEFFHELSGNSSISDCGNYSWSFGIPTNIPPAYRNSTTQIPPKTLMEYSLKKSFDSFSRNYFKKILQEILGNSFGITFGSFSSFLLRKFLQILLQQLSQAVTWLLYMVYYSVGSLLVFRMEFFRKGSFLQQLFRKLFLAIFWRIYL